MLEVLLVLKDRKHVATFAICSRLFVIVAMSISCFLIPDHNPGDDVLRFDLRLGDSNAHGDADVATCFCLRGHACDLEMLRIFENDYGNAGILGVPPSLSDELIRFREKNEFVCADTNSTRDSNSRGASRWVESFYKILLDPMTKWDSARFLTLAADPLARYPLPCTSTNDKDTCPDPFLMSEQAHAFFPMVPWIFRLFSREIVHLLPAWCLPPTYEGVVALSALLANLTCFTIAAVALFDLTLILTSPPIQSSSVRMKDSSIMLAASTTTCIFIINPASVFFSVAYSESFFAMCTFLGHNLAARNRYIAACLPWMVASYARSNGTLNALWILLQVGVASGIKRRRTIVLMISQILYSLTLSLVVTFPIWFHDRNGIYYHCQNSSELQPSWCSDGRGETPFSLYRYVQKEHWNVGLFRYYQWKQIPNFLLAAPILILGIGGAISWVKCSFSGFVDRSGSASDASMIIRWIEWAMIALDDSVSPLSSKQLSGGLNLVDNPSMLAHYAVMAAVSILGLTIAHVQISTRLICSSCPAIYWFMTHCIRCRNRKGSNYAERGIIAYCYLYTFLGVVLHANFLPWT